jgi:hypothetical protein
MMPLEVTGLLCKSCGMSDGDAVMIISSTHHLAAQLAMRAPLIVDVTLGTFKASATDDRHRKTLTERVASGILTLAPLAPVMWVQSALETGCIRKQNTFQGQRRFHVFHYPSRPDTPTV